MIEVRSDFDVVLVDHLGTDHRPVQAARTSTQGPEALETGQGPGLTNRLIGDRHGVPFEHIVITWLLTIPIAVARELVRHRHSSISEESARYRQLRPVFYIPPRGRLFVQVGKAMDYHFEPATDLQYDRLSEALYLLYDYSYAKYESLLGSDIAREVARLVLPVGIYTTMMVTMNGRGLMNFLSLRVKSDASTYPTNPMWEINQVADQMENHFAELYPVIHTKFVENGRVCP